MYPGETMGGQAKRPRRRTTRVEHPVVAEDSAPTLVVVDEKTTSVHSSLERSLQYELLRRQSADGASDDAPDDER